MAQDRPFAVDSPIEHDIFHYSHLSLPEGILGETRRVCPGRCGWTQLQSQCWNTHNVRFSLVIIATKYDNGQSPIYFDDFSSKFFIYSCFLHNVPMVFPFKFPLADYFPFPCLLSEKVGAQCSELINPSLKEWASICWSNPCAFSNPKCPVVVSTNHHFVNKIINHIDLSIMISRNNLVLHSSKHSINQMTGCHIITSHYSYGHLPVISGYKWDYTFYTWGYNYNWKMAITVIIVQSLIITGCRSLTNTTL